MPTLFTHKKVAPKDGCELSYLFDIYKPKPGCPLIKFTNLAFPLFRFLPTSKKSPFEGVPMGFYPIFSGSVHFDG